MPTTREKIEALLATYDERVRDAFLECLDDVRSAIVLKIVIERLEKGDIQGAIDAMQIEADAYAPLERAIAEAYDAGGQGAVSDLPRVTDPNGHRVVWRFGIRNPAAEAALREHSSNLVARIVEDQKQAIRIALEEGLAAGQNPRATALEVVGRINRATGKREGGIIGLTAPQERYVATARADLLSGDPERLKHYLTLERRDKRFDRSVTAAIRAGKPVDAQIVAAATGRYSDRLLALRGELIARTETMTAIGRAREDAMRQQIAAGKIESQDVTKVWHSAGDKRVRDTHRLLNGRSAELDGVFHSSSGAVLRYPGDPKSPASEIIGCRCWMEYRVDYVGAAVRRFKAEAA
ncbi:phage minor head protein [Aureimonas sp. N4]|uniref:phage minor head protein n=1 Tax=Aureimonas sp. N4 TaxID=1638165 RepID=UPI00078264C8|nr:phage minor head protein [Aureimonas sp. N4]